MTNVNSEYGAEIKKVLKGILPGYEGIDAKIIEQEGKHLIEFTFDYGFANDKEIVSKINSNAKRLENAGLKVGEEYTTYRDYEYRDGSQGIKVTLPDTSDTIVRLQRGSEQATAKQLAQEVKTNDLDPKRVLELAAKELGLEIEVKQKGIKR